MSVDAYRSTFVKATRKQFFCEGCRKKIEQGASCYSVFCVFDGEPCSYRLHRHCQEHMDSCESCKEHIRDCESIPDLRDCDQWHEERDIDLGRLEG